ncbi:MAG: 4-hydroxy-2-oxovalerate aldolase [Candidatus Omnitrophica bacterium]|nr:4-hydroxy-2-oxovalerate aldolase [Candidatus Omnitrophota bacterium]
MTTEGRQQAVNRLRGRELFFLAWTSLGHPAITEIFTKSGVDGVGIDMEHGAIDPGPAAQIIAAAHAGGRLCLPRLPSLDGSLMRRLLDSDADGVIVPNVTTLLEVRSIVESCKYPPVGKRSFGVARAQGYGFDFEEYAKGWNRRSVILIQIESVAGVEAVDDLLGHEAVDGAMVGPYDLSGSLGVPGQLDHPRVSEVCRRVVEACRRHGKACGTQIVDPNPDNLSAAVREGYTFLVLASDVFLLWKWGERMRALIRLFAPQAPLPAARRGA